LHNTVAILASISTAAIVCQWIAWRVRLPAILFLLLTGIIAGPIAGLFDPQEVFGHILLPFVSLSVAVILFEGSLSLKFEEIAGLQKVVRNLVTTGVLTTWFITAIGVYYILDFSVEIALLFGAITVVTGPTVITPMLRTIRPKENLANILRWEGIVIDPIGALLVVLVYEFIISSTGAQAVTHTILTFGKIIIIGLVLGLAAGQGLGMAIRDHWLPEFLHNVGVLSIVFAMYALSDVLQPESGLMTVTIMGIRLANMKKVPLEGIADFKESLSVFLISMLFIILAADLEFEKLRLLGPGAFLVFLLIQFIARPVKIAVATFGSGLTWREKALLGWIAPRGIVAAAVSALFAIRLQEAGYAEAESIVPLTFAVIIGTVALQSSTAGYLAKLLGVAEPIPKGYLIIGANPVARMVAKIITKNDYRALLADTNWENIKEARMEGFQTYFGNPISDHAERYLNLVGIGKMLALSPNPDLNIIASIHFRHEFGRKKVFSLLVTPEKDSTDKHLVSSDLRGYVIFGSNVTYAKLASLIAKDAEVKSTKLTESFTYGDYIEQYGARAITLFALTPKGKLEIFVEGYKMKPADGWTIISLIEPEPESAQNISKPQKNTSPKPLPG